MQHLWAPWRMEYVKRPQEGSCFLCEVQKEGDTSLVVWQGRFSFCVLNRYPYNNGHLLLAPKAHKSSLSELSNEELLELVRATEKFRLLLKRALGPDGFNLGINFGKVAGAGLPEHLHIHLVPRWEGDTSFMSTVADVRVIPQSLQELHDALTRALEDSP